MTKWLKIPVPDWVDLDVSHIWVFQSQGRELIARKLAGRGLEVKTVRCNLCGKCCFDVGHRWIFGSDEEGKCTQLKWESVTFQDGTRIEGFFCKAPGDLVPFSCCKGRHEDPELCQIRFEEVK